MTEPAPEQEPQAPPKPPTSLPKRVYTLLLIVICEPFAQMMIYPFLPHMVQNFEGTGILQDMVPLQIGLIGSAYALAQFLSAGVWQRISDGIGKKPVLMIGLLGNATFSILFGLVVHNLYAAVGARFFWGLMNGNVGVAKAMIGENTDSTNESKAFAYYGVCFGSGFIFGGAVGGLLSVPNELFGLDVALFEEHPYILPCFVNTGLCLFALVLALTALPSKPASTAEASKRDDHVAEISVNIPWTFYHIIGLLSFPLINFIQVMYMELFVMWSSTESTLGGLGFSVGELGLALTATAFLGVIIQLLIYPLVTRVLGIFNGMTVGYYLYAVAIFSLVYLNMVNENRVVLWLVLLLVIQPVRVLAACLAFTNGMVFVNRVGKKRSALGATKGSEAINRLGQTLSGIAKVVAPIASGGLFGWSIAGSENAWPLDVSLTFNVIAVLCLLGAGLSAMLNETKI